MAGERLLEVQGLSVSFPTEKGMVTAVDGVSFGVDEGETLGIVGESGCGKSVTAEAILRLFDERATRYGGKVLFQGKDLMGLSTGQMEAIRGNEISMVFQDPMSSLNPVHTIGSQIAESVRLHTGCSRKEAGRRAVELLRLTGIPSPEQRVHEHPHELSGGMRQRVMIAMALACQPKLLIADEPTTALDVTIQAQILDLIHSLKSSTGMGVVLITHDLGVVAEVCTRVVVMYLGQVIEEADVHTLFERPLHPYTIGLMRSMPTIDGDRTGKLHVIEGTVPSLHDIPAGCRFAPRCSYADERCQSEMPELERAEQGGHIRCWHHEQIRMQEGESVYAAVH
ncbi:ABC transporter ATP-binding protein [Paenibacillus filicis]|uniref:ABC transporter ATP-binding protein n=1 Tax=Paenibacillus filicis TaxID=669464 RepID=A0ABU9DI54_9BACL